MQNAPKSMLILNIDKIHTTELGIERIRKNLKLPTKNPLPYCKNLILNPKSHIYQLGKNYYCEIENIKLTINANSFSIITAHLNQQ